VACVPVAAQVKWPLIASMLNVLGLVGKVIVTVNGPQSYDDAELETLSYHRPVEEESGTRIEVVMEGKEVAVIVAVGQGFM
jgi:hypothetical protein